MEDKDLEKIKRLVEQKPPVRNRSPASKAALMRRREERQKRQRRQKIFFYTVAVSTIVLFSVGIVLIFNCFSADQGIVGTWDYDSVTIYRFDKKGKGELELPNRSYTFSYAIDKDMLSIDFDDKNATDNNYIFSVSDNKLTLTAESSDAVYVLTKKKGS